VRKRFTARAARVGDMRMAVEMAILELRYAEVGKDAGLVRVGDV
jgi:hypothetical protein